MSQSHKSQSPSREKNFISHRPQNSRDSSKSRDRQESFGNINLINVIPMLFRRFSTDDNILIENVGFGKGWKKNWTSFRLLLKYNLGSLSRSLTSFIIGLSAVFLVVLIIILINNLQVHLKYFNLKTVENLVSSSDIVITASKTTESPFLNYTFIKNSLLNVPELSQMAPRWVIPVDVVNNLNGKSSKAIAVIVDSKTEDMNEIAPLWNNRPLGMNEMHCSESLIRNLNLLPNSGNTLDIILNLTSFQSPNQTRSTIKIPLNGNPLPESTIFVVNSLNVGFGLSNDNGKTNLILPNTFLNNFDQTNVSFQIIDAISNTNGKYANALGNVVLLDKSAFYYVVKNTISSGSLALTNVSIDELAKNFTNSINLDEYVAYISVVVKDRYATYLLTTKESKGVIARFANSISESVGVLYPIFITDVIMSALETAQFLEHIFNEIFFTIVFVLIILAVAVIYSLMNKDVNEKTYEYGMLRSLGLPQSSLVYLLLQKALIFAIPGILCSTLFSYILNLPLSYLVSSQVGNDIASNLTPSSIILGIFIGVLLPIIGIIIPTRKALGTTLRDALDLYHSTVGETKITVQKLKSFGISPVETTMSLLFVGFGFLVYYMVPLSFVFQDFTLFFRVFTLILMGLIIGLIIISQFLLAPLEVIAAYALTKVYDRVITDIVIKNLSAHRIKNRYTSLVFTLCLSFIIFASVMFNIQADSLNKLTQSTIGSDIRLTASSYGNALDKNALSNLLSTKTVNIPGFSNIVEGYSFASFDLIDYFVVMDATLTSQSGFLPVSASIYGIEEGFKKSAYPEYIMVQEPVNILGEVDALNLLYRYKSDPYTPKVDGISSSKIKKTLNKLQRTIIPFIANKPIMDDLYFPISKFGELILYILPVSDINTVTSRFIVKPVATVSKMSGFPDISSFTKSATMLVKMDDFKSLLSTVDTVANTNVTVLSKTDLPLKDCFIKLSQDASNLQIESFMNELNTILNQDIIINDARAAIKNTQDTKTKGNFTLNSVSIGAIILCFFVLIISFESNVKDNSWEYGVLRSLGFTKAILVRVYIYESMSIVLSSAALGTLIGSLTGVFFCLQSNVFLELPWAFSFPLEFYIVIILLACILAVTGSILPSLELNKKTISATIKGTK